MQKHSGIDNILDFAIGKEEEAYKFYTDTARKMKIPAIKQVFKDFAEEEVGHQKKLIAIKKSESLKPTKEKIIDLQLSEYTVDEQPRDNMEYRDVLVLAMKKEKAAFRLYSDLAQQASNPTDKNILLSLAQEEAKHKLRFEIEYEDNFLTEKGY